MTLLGTNQVPTLYSDQNLLPLNRHVNMNLIGRILGFIATGRIFLNRSSRKDAKGAKTWHAPVHQPLITFIAHLTTRSA